jgi:cation/acetate symporter
MPHILMRFFTVPDAKTARSSVLWAMLLIGGCHFLIIAIGFAAAHYVGALKIVALDKGGNLAAPLLAQFLGGGADSLMGNFLLAFVAAVAFATIVAVVAGLTLAAASSLAHDIYVGTIKNGDVSPRQQVVAAKIAAVLVGVLSIGCALLAKGQNVAHLVGLAFAVAASANFPALLLTLYWKRCNTRGVLAGVVGGTLCAIFLVMVSPNMQYPLLQLADARKTVQKTGVQLQQLEGSALAATAPADKARLEKAIAGAKTLIAATQERIARLEAGPRTSIVGLEKPLVELRNPGLISVPIGFLLVILGSLFGTGVTTAAVWDQMRVRRYTGLGQATAVSH